MKKKQAKKAIKAAINKFEGVKWVDSEQFTIQTVLGPLWVCIDLEGSIFSAFMRFTEGLNENQLNEFKRLIGTTKGLNTWSFKWNKHTDNIEDLIQCVNQRFLILTK